MTVFYSPIVDRFEEKAREIIDSRYEYETTHKDSGDSYSHLAGEGSFDYDNGTERLRDYCAEHGIDVSGVDIDRVAEDVIFWGEMVPGQDYDPKQRFLVCSHAVGEIEIEIDASEIGARATEYLAGYLSRNTDAFWTVAGRQTFLAYVNATESYWDHVCDLDQIKNIVADHRERNAA